MSHATNTPIDVPNAPPSRKGNGPEQRAGARTKRKGTSRAHYDERKGDLNRAA